MRPIVGAIGACLVLAVPLGAAAQQTGGSFGSSDDDWGDHSSSSSSHSSSSRASERRHDESHRRDDDDDDDHGHSGSHREEPRPYEDDAWIVARVPRGEPPVTPEEAAALGPRVASPIAVRFGSAVLAAVVAVIVFRVRKWRRARRWEDAREEREERARARQLVLDHSRTWMPAPRAAPSHRPAPSRAPTSVRVTRFSVGFAPAARPALQARLAELSRRPMKTPDDRHEVATKIAEVIAAHADDARYVLLERQEVATTEGPSTLARVSLELRARYHQDTVGRVRSAAPPELRARPEDGPGLLVVSLVVGSSSVAPLPAQPIDASSVAHVARSLVPAPLTLRGLEVVWSPSEEADRLSSYELEALYPELTKLAAAALDVGAVRCSACAGGFSRELSTCPHCGQPVTERSP